MVGLRYPWSRSWLPVGTPPPLVRGFLEELSPLYAHYVDSPAKPLTDFDDLDCLVLFGDAGMGKSTELKDDHVARRAAGQLCVWLDLGAYDTWSEALAQLHTDPDLLMWRCEPSRPLMLMIDSVDEVSTSMRTLSDQTNRLLDELTNGPLHLRVASRSAGYPTRLRGALKDRFGESYAELDLAPLTAGDALLAAQVAGFGDGSEFMSAVLHRDVGLLASRPITLDMLLKLYESGPLPDSKVELYRRGMQRLVRERNPRRLDAADADLPLESLLDGASTLATVTVLAGHSTIARHPYPGLPEGQVCLDEVSATDEEAAVLAAVTQSALFAARSDNTVGWTHREFPEFLTAGVLAAMDTSAAVALLADPAEPDRVVPQLIGTAVWAALMKREIFEWLLFRQPELLAAGAGPDLSPKLRRRLMGALLEQIERTPPLNRRVEWWRLNYDKLPNDLAPCLQPDKPLWLRREAAHILFSTGQHELDPQLASVVEELASAGQPDDNSLDIRLASAVIAALRNTTNAAVLQRLNAVALDPGAPWTIRSDIIGDMWWQKPTLDVLATLDQIDLPSTPPDLAGPIGRDLASAVLEGAATVGAIVDWMAAHRLPTHLPASPTDPTNPDLEVADDPGDDWVWVVEACVLAAAATPGSLTDEQWRTLAAMYASMIDRIEDPFRWRRDGLDFAHPDGRRRVSEAVLTIQPGPYTAHHLIQAQLIRSDDLEWLLGRWASAPAESELRRSYLRALRMIAEPTPENRNLARAVTVKLPAVTELLESLFSDAAIARHAASIAEQERKQQEDAAAAKAADFDRDRFLAALAVADWPAMVAELHKPFRGKQWAWGASLALSPGWQLLSNEQRNQALGVATRYITDLGASQQPTPADIIGDTCTLLGSLNPALLDGLDKDAAIEWLRNLVGMPAQHTATALLTAALPATHASQVDQILIPEIVGDAARGGPAAITRLGSYTSPAVEDALEQVARAPAADGSVVLAALRALLHRDEPRAATIAHDLMRRRPPERPQTGVLIDPKDLAWRRWNQAAAATAALAYSPAIEDRLHSLLAELATPADFAATVLAWAEPRNPNDTPWSALSPQRKAELLIWAERNLPKEPDYRPGRILPVRSVFEFPRLIRDMLLLEVSEEGVSAIRSAATELDDAWLRSQADELAIAVREASWAAPSPGEIRRLISDPHKRAISTEAQLAQVLLDGLDIVANQIAQDTDRRAAYWHEQRDPKGTFEPLSEEQFMAQLRWHLATAIRGVSLRREVELNHRLAEVAGSKIDIEATVRAGDRDISVLIEGKGIWNPKVETDMRTQLHDRYLTGAPSYTGIYVVAAYRGEQWLEGWRRTAARRRDPKRLHAHLMAEASSLSKPPRAVHVRIIDIPLDPKL